MQIFLVRHANAVDETLDVRDPMRFLTPDGRHQALQLGDRLRWHDCTPTHVWSSPFVRAVQTAELLVAGLHSEVAVAVAPALAPGSTTTPLVAAIRALPADSCVVLVSHEPQLSMIGAALLGHRDVVTLGRAEAARIVNGQLRWRFAWNADAPTIATL